MPTGQKSICKVDEKKAGDDLKGIRNSDPIEQPDLVFGYEFKGGNDHESQEGAH